MEDIGDACVFDAEVINTQDEGDRSGGMGPEPWSKDGSRVLVTSEKRGEVVMGNAPSLWETVHSFVDANVGFAIGSSGCEVVMGDDGWGEGVKGKKHIFGRR